MAETESIELVQGKTWEIDGTVYNVENELLDWADYAVRSQARKKYPDVAEAWEWDCTTGSAGHYTLYLGATATELIAKGTYVCDVEIYSTTNSDTVYEAKRLLITVLPEATK